MATSLLAIGEISCTHSGEYEDMSSGILRLVVWYCCLHHQGGHLPDGGSKYL
jgi:hypothetical protein